jgi:hypothetical protein
MGAVFTTRSGALFLQLRRSWPLVLAALLAFGVTPPGPVNAQTAGEVLALRAGIFMTIGGTIRSEKLC